MKTTALGARAALLGAVLLLACGNDDAMGRDDSPTGTGMGGRNSMTSMAGAGGNDGQPTDDQTPPIGAAELMAWLRAGTYEDWTCEPEIHEARSPSPHGFNRICSNDIIAENAAGSDDWPAGAAAVKELHAGAAGGTPIGYAVYLKTEADSAGGANWYWYEVVPSDHPAAPPDASGVVADGMGDSGPAKTICVGCHAAAGADTAHTPSMGGRDQVYTPVQDR
jgi:hypothetical protein